MTGYESKKKAAQAKLEQAKEILLQHPQKDIDWQREQHIKAHAKLNDDDDDTQVYKDHGDALTAAYMSGYHDGKKQRPWVGLTDEEIYNLKGFYDYMTKDEFFEAVRGVEAKLKDKNT